MTRSPLTLLLLALLARRWPAAGRALPGGPDADRLAAGLLAAGAAVLVTRLVVVGAAVAGLVLAGVALVVGLALVGPLTAP